MAGNRRSLRVGPGGNRAQPAVAPGQSFAELAERQFTSDFWSRFARDHWEKRPLLIRQPFAEPLVNPAEVFRAVVEASELYRAAPEDSPLAFYIEHALVEASVEDYLPLTADETMAGYANRITPLLHGQRFAFIVEDLQAYSAELWRIFREFLRGLDAAVSDAGAHRKATVFIGNYGMTPSGLHVGTSGNFKFVVEGRKRMRFWPDEYFRGRKGINHSVHVEPFLPDATTLYGEAGDVIYWPSDQWHIGEAVDGLSASVSLAVFVKSQIDQLPSVASEAAIATWLNRKTSAGFRRVPGPALTRPLEKDALVRGDPRDPIRWHPGGNADVICSANGHAFAFKPGKKILAILERLNTGAICSVRDLIALASGTSDRDPNISTAVHALLQKLYRLRALSVEVRK